MTKIVSALDAALSYRGIKADELNPWYFPTMVEYKERLERGGFEVTSMALFPRPTPLPGNITGWLETFAESFTSALPPPERLEFIMEVQEALRPELCREDGKWTADYVRLRFAANKRGS